jgi:hypothetical protein
MDFTLPEDLTALLDRIDEFIEAEIRPLELAPRKSRCAGWRATCSAS